MLLLQTEESGSCIAETIVVLNSRNSVGHKKECFGRGRNESPKWAVMGMSQDTIQGSPGIEK